ncbi:MAG: hypothetical protein JWM14_632 [Chitinophagaceae bacterium]|nr:hypothetical protein [Chitinophagaceae bacterium]
MKKTIKVITYCIAVFICNSCFAQLQDVLMLTVSSGSHSDQTAVRFLSEATDTFDSQYDAYKWTNPGMTPNLFTVSDEKYAINALYNEFEEKNVVLYFTSAFSGTYTLAAEEIGAFDSTWSITLVDEKLNLERDLRAYATYVFQSQKGEEDSRFLLKFKIKKTDSDITAVNAEQRTNDMIYAYGENILIRMEGENDRVFITDMLGYEILNTDLSLTKGTVWSFCPGKAGFYIVSLQRNNKRYYKKVYTNPYSIL